MKRIAFFVEGQTEQIFLKRFVREYLGMEEVLLIMKRTRGGTNMPHQELVRGRIIPQQPKYMVLICDCGADNRVKSEVLDQMESLKEAGYICVVGMRDLYPMTDNELPRLEHGMRFLPINLKALSQIFKFFIVVQEVETWFLSETKHFLKVDKKLTANFIKQRLGFDPYAENMLLRKHPADDLDKIYRLVHKAYTKKYWQVEKMVDKLDIKNLLTNVRHEIPSLNELITVLEEIKQTKK